jgi:ATP-dependent Clp protease adaptor protein ClpS
MSEGRPDSSEWVSSDTDTDTDEKEPPMYRVILHNDDYTTMEFVVDVLVHVFHRPVEEATRIMLNVHRKGVGICGTYPYEVAETKVDTVHLLAQEKGFPLKCSMEEE